MLANDYFARDVFGYLSLAELAQAARVARRPPLGAQRQRFVPFHRRLQENFTQLPLMSCRAMCLSGERREAAFGV